MSKNTSDIGEFFMVGLPGTVLDDSTRLLIAEHRINHFILFKRNVVDKDQLRNLCRDLRYACAAQGMLSPLISIDQEGGTVTRLPLPFTQFPEARQLAESPDAEQLLINYARTTARELQGVGINLNLAPVLDVCPAGQGFFMERRSLGGETATVAKLGSLIIMEMQDLGLAACAKHFPGLGRAVVDPHHQLSTVSQSSATIKEDDLPPFRAAMAVEVAAIMTSHTIYRDMDSENAATLSTRILTDLLREEMGYQGVIITDDLEMGAIEKEGAIDRAALQAFQAGADLLLICHEHDKVVRSLNTLKSAVEQGLVSEGRLAASRARLRDMARRYAIPLRAITR